MFPYPSGAGLHVGHPLGYIASDVMARYKKLKGFNVLHPMGFDSFGLPAEQYAIETGQHPAKTTQENIAQYRQQLDLLGFSFDWDREIQTSDSSYYQHTQWIFAQLFLHYYDFEQNKALPIALLVQQFEQSGNSATNAANDCAINFDASQWKNFSTIQKEQILLQYRLAFLSETFVNWCPKLGTVLANDEVKDGLSERGGHPVERKKMKQWSLRISAYSERLLKDLTHLDWSDAVKEMQRNWIGKSTGALLDFSIENHTQKLRIFTTRPDTIFGVSFVAIAPEHDLAIKLANDAQKDQVSAYIQKTKNRSERERQSDIKNISGVFTGSYAIHPLTQEKIPIWLADYVLGSYGTGAVMGVPAGDQRDWDFAQHFNLPIINIFENNVSPKMAVTSKEAVLANSQFLNGLNVQAAQEKILIEINQQNIGKSQTNYRLRDAIFSRQRYWGEPIPIVYQDGMPQLIDPANYPVVLPEIDAYLPTETGEPPLARAKNFMHNHLPIETNTMPGWAGSSWYFLRYLDPKNRKELADQAKINYWQNVDLYIGGAEHATGHLIYARFWTKFLFDIGIIPFEEPFKKMINQGMILGKSALIYRIKNTHQFVSFYQKEAYETTPIHVDVNLVTNDVLDIESFKNWRKEYQNATFILEPDGTYRCGAEVEKMSKSKYNVVNPNVLVAKYGADTLRLYEMFLGPLEQFKPWDTKGIEGVHRFLKKVWRLFYQNNTWIVSQETPSKKALQILHKTIQKVEDDLTRFSFNTVVSNLMIAANELSEENCHQ
ncbi:MAG: leucine--tRNA ligase, partial [Bacteroidota bacterium]